MYLLKLISARVIRWNFTKQNQSKAMVRILYNSINFIHGWMIRGEYESIGYDCVFISNWHDFESINTFHSIRGKRYTWNMNDHHQQPPHIMTQYKVKEANGIIFVLQSIKCNNLYSVRAGFFCILFSSLMYFELSTDALTRELGLCWYVSSLHQVYWYMYNTERARMFYLLIQSFVHLDCTLNKYTEKELAKERMTENIYNVFSKQIFKI